MSSLTVVTPLIKAVLELDIFPLEGLDALSKSVNQDRKSVV